MTMSKTSCTRYEHGEFFSEDRASSIPVRHHQTSIGRAVYGGGGITPRHLSFLKHTLGTDILLQGS